MMKLGAVATTLFVALVAPTGTLAANEVSAKNPISRVTKLLQELSNKLQRDLKKEEDLFDRYNCWYKSVVDSKTSSNSAAQSRIESLEAYIADIDAGRIEFTTERADLELQLKGLNRDLETAAALRAKETEDFQAAKKEMEQAIAALGEAIQALEKGTQESLTQTKSVRLLNMKWRLRKALEFGRRLLSVSDAKYLESILDGEVPQKDWKKLNRKATFKMEYKARSGEILQTLKDMDGVFKKNLAEAEASEADAQSKYDVLTASKKDMKTKTEQSLIALVEENGARGLSKQEASDEVAALKAQVAADKKFIAEVESVHTDKEKEWKARKELRLKEITAISEALQTLASDEAKDAFTASYKGYALVQTEMHDGRHRHRRHGVHHHGRHHAHHRHHRINHRSRCASKRLHKLAWSARDERIIFLARMASTGSSSIDLVITKIDELVSMLKKEEEADLKNKEDCENKTASLARKAKTVSVAIDDLTDDMTRSKEKIAELKTQISEQLETQSRLNSSLVELKRQREDEKKQFMADKLDDEKAVALIEQAMNILKDMKSQLSTGTSGAQTLSEPVLLQVDEHEHRDDAQQDDELEQPFEIEAGKAPPPPPATWEDPTYKGAEGENNGIIGILTLIRDDMKQDISSAKKQEADAVVAYGEITKDLKVRIQASKDAITSIDSEKATHEKDVTDKEQLKATKKGELEGNMDELKALKPGCNFIMVNYKVRIEKRNEEIDGLLKAKAILAGADFPDQSFLQSC